MPDPLYGEVWLAELDPTRGREQAGRRPVLVISEDLFNTSRADLVIVLPLSTRYKGVPLHAKVLPPEGGLKYESYIRCEDIRSIAKERFVHRYGAVSSGTLAAVNYRLRMLLKL